MTCQAPLTGRKVAELVPIMARPSCGMMRVDMGTNVPKVKNLRAMTTAASSHLISNANTRPM